MITTDRLSALAHRYVLRDGETVTWSKAFPDGPGLYVETADRAYLLSTARNVLRAEGAAWVDALVVVTREDVHLSARPPARMFLLRRDGGTVCLDDADDVAGLGPLLHTGGLDELAYAELLIHGQWRGGWSKRIVADPDTWRGDYPQPARIPPIGRPDLRRGVGTLAMTFAASREYAQAAGARSVLDVAEWSVTASADAPATWERRLLAEAVPLAAPW